MISYLKGNIMHKTANSLMLLCGAVGYEIFVPLNRLPLYNLQQEVEFYIYAHYREDGATLFGLTSWEERELYQTLLNVSGIGPKGALALIGQATLAGLHQAIREENVAFLTKVPGIGKKTAQRLVLELKDKLPAYEIDDALVEDLGLEVKPTAIKRDDITEVLLSLGYHESEIRKVYPELKKMGDVDEQTIIKKALQLLAKF